METKTNIFYKRENKTKTNFFSHNKLNVRPRT